MSSVLTCKDKKLDLKKPNIMGILNATPDSFSDGGKYNTIDKALSHAINMVNAGATIIDVGGESTRPKYAKKISAQEQLDRVLPVIESIKSELNVIVSVDTSEAEVMEAAINSGAGIINDVRGLTQAGALEVAAKLDVPVVIMHSIQQTENTCASSNCIIDRVMKYLMRRVEIATASGIRRENIIIDPGFGGGMFGKTPKENIHLLKEINRFHSLNLPLLAGASKKSFMGDLFMKPIEERSIISLGCSLMLLNAGVQIIRVHDVAPTMDMVKLSIAIKNLNTQ